MTSPTEQAAQATALRADLKTHGLEHAVRLMSVPARGAARRLIRDALYCYILKMLAAAEPGNGVKVQIEFSLPEEPTPFRKFTQPSGKLVTTLREAIENEDAEALGWLSTNVLDMVVANFAVPEDDT